MYQSNLLKRLFTFLLLSVSLLFAQDQADVDFKVSLDYSRFSIDGGVYLDVYLMIPQSIFTFVEIEGGWEAQVVFQTALIQDDIVPYDPDRWTRTYRAPDKQSIAKLTWVPDISKFYVEPGDYTLQVTIVDVHSKKKQTMRRPVSLELYPQDELAISDITIASQVIKAKKENEFTRYGYDVVPNAQRTFSSSAPMMYYFFEAYGLSGTGDYVVHAQILSLNGDIVQDFPASTKKMPGTSVVEWGGLNTAGLGSGIYKLSVEISDGVTQKTATQKRTFYILRETASKQEETGPKDDYAGLSASQVDDIYKVVSVIMDKKEKRLFEKSDDVGKRRVLTAFWDRRDPDIETPVNEFKVEFYQRVQVANRDFGIESDNGWSTDRGRVLIKYGPPSNIERQQSSLDQKPWVTWEYYDIEGGVHFIFVDRTGYGSFQLVHSNARDEVQDSDWERYLE
ncbi:MAG: GWxTD domain-containing protein [Candidatus Marinimicrobia bacterium]|nr:GWxTD domain-containing protein [Candidatus Neomarinimicrobiota bacterium]MBT3574585.1 GWxTD domain-containing protein [Candidatus Neomarinimicrobiota bacterium]MBT3680447.1 GWxTD domain-containing protein [Candidatus Neomarinimicrobiota bacterium]MBT3951004.1 GWxTD domain-containing protein [Candidatus Neomarinimicrobiota bacterium]MBT4253048.1 GWxTD domain-containing protein [Candidatus Neomarinimicrobiota bacterium]